MGYIDEIHRPGPKKLLALDGGGIRGVLSLEVLARIEQLVQQHSADPTLTLGGYFDFIGGTSTGAIIAAGLARGMSVEKIRRVYVDHGKEMFTRASLFARLWSKYDDKRLLTLMQETFGPHTTFGDTDMKCLLMVMMRNAATDSPWPISNNPDAKYNDRTRADCNLDIPLWQLVRASTAAPYYFPAEEIVLGASTSEAMRTNVFVDGGVTMHNNPAFQMFLMASLGAYRLNWPTGESEMLVVSVGTGTAPDANPRLRRKMMNLAYTLKTIPGALMGGALNEQDMLCRVFGRCLHGGALDREVGTLVGLSDGIHDVPRLFTYVRYNALLTTGGLADLGLPNIDANQVKKLDAVDNIIDLQRIGRVVAEKVSPEHFSGFLAPEPGPAPD